MYNRSYFYLIGIMSTLSLSAIANGRSAEINLLSVHQPTHDQYLVVLKPDSQQMLFNPEAKKNFVNNQSKIFSQTLNVHVIDQYSTAISALLVQVNNSQLEQIKLNPNVEYVERDQEVSVVPISYENDDDNESHTQTDVEWGLDRIDQHDLPLDEQYNYKYDGTGVTAYIIDTGLTVDHEEFGERASGYNDASKADCYGHGTHVAGIIGSSTYGVAKNVNLVGLKVLNCSGKGRVSDIIKAIDWVAENGVKPSVVNLSIGSLASKTEDAAIKALVLSGIQPIVAAGNSNKDACQYSPSGADDAVTVGATTNKDTRASFSNYGKCVNIFAPGDKILSTYKGESNTATRIMSGTSMASPFVTGVAALYLQENPELTPMELRQLLIDRSSKDKIEILPHRTPNNLVYSLPQE